MSVQTKLSAKGQCVIPAEVRARLGWREGDLLDVTETGDRVVLRRSSAEALAKLGGPISWEEFRRRVPPHEGPPVTLEEMDQAIEAEVKRRIGGKLGL